MVSALQLESNQSYIRLAKEEGAQHVFGGEILPGEGYFMSPALFIGDNDMCINREEMFAPIACVIRAKIMMKRCSWPTTPSMGWYPVLLPVLWRGRGIFAAALKPVA